MVNYSEMITALAADYLNVYVIEPEKDSGSVIKLDGYVVEGLEDKPKDFAYTKLLQTYATTRVCAEDRACFLSSFSSEALLKAFSEESKDKVEFSYRTETSEGIAHYTALYIKVSKPGKPLRLVAGFRNVDDIIYAEKKKESEATLKAYEAISDIYVSMHRIDLKTDLYETIKTSEAMEKAAPSQYFSENIRTVVEGMADSGSKLPVASFLNTKTLEERMKGKKHISIHFQSKSYGSCRLHFIKESEDEEGRLRHVLFAVEQLDENKYQSVFDVLSQDYLCVFYLSLDTERGRFLKAAGEKSEESKDSVFEYDRLLETLLKDYVDPAEREGLGKALSLKKLKEVCKEQDSYSGNFKAIVDGKSHHYSFLFSKMKELNFLVCGFRNIDSLIESHAKEEKKKREEETKRVKELEEQAAIFNNLARNFRNVYIADLNTCTAKILKLGKDYDNPELISLIGKTFPYEDVISSWINSRVHPDDRGYLAKALSLENIKAKLSKSSEMSGTYRSYDNGKLRNYQYSISKIDDSGRVIAGFQVIDKIIEEHLAAEKKQKEKEEAYQRQLEESYRKLQDMRDILAASKMGTWKIYLIEGKEPSMEADDLMKNLLGIEGKSLSKEEIYSAWFDNIIPAAVPSVLASVKKMEEEGFDENTYLWKHPTRGERYVRCGGTAIKVEGGYVLRGYHYDVDSVVRGDKEKERKLAEATLLEKKHSEVISSIAKIYSTIFSINIKTSAYEIINQPERFHSLAPKQGNFKDIIELACTKMIAEDCKEAKREFLDLDTLGKRLERSGTLALDFRENSGRWFQGRFIEKSRNDQGEIEEVLYVAREITKEKEEEAKQENALRDALLLAKHASRAKTTFLNNMSHDIRTPMNAIIGFTALAETHINNKDQVQDYLGKIHTSSTHLLSLINEILDMSRIESGTVKLEENPVHMPDVLHDLRTMIQGQVSAKQQNLYIDTLDVVHEDVIADKLRLNQVLLNIVSNAIKYTGIGGNIFIRVSELPCSKEGYTTYQFSVKDNGIGMSEEFKSTVFDAFSRERSSTVSGIQGTGLGMSITKNIVELMGGNIEVESEKGKGSEFKVTVDFVLADKAIVFSPIPSLKGARALVVDDDIYTCQSVSKMLRDISMRPDWSTSGKEAIVRAKEAFDIKDEYKVLIIDYLMPDMNGIEAVRQIRKVIGEEIPIIVLTAYDWSDIEEEAREAGVTAFVAKPIFMSELREALSSPKQKRDEKPSEETGEYDFSGKRVLLVEDNDLNREIATALLNEIHVEVETANDGTDAISVISKSPEKHFDAVFMDIQMPKMDGYTATREIRTLPSNSKANLPIIAMTANAFEEDRQKAFEAGMNGHIAKPISVHSIGEALKKIFNK